MGWTDQTGNRQFFIGQWHQITGGADIGRISTEKVHVKHIGFGLVKRRLSAGDRVQQQRRDKNQIVFFHSVGSKVDLVVGISFGDECKFSLFVPVRCYDRIIRL